MENYSQHIIIITACQFTERFCTFFDFSWHVLGEQLVQLLLGNFSGSDGCLWVLVQVPVQCLLQGKSTVVDIANAL